jgi:Spy/CpxP family protein refolding chaperone
MRKRTIAILAVAALLVVGGIFTFAQRTMHRGGFGMHGGHGAMMALKALDLTDDQKAKVKEIFETNKQTMQPIREQLKANHEKLAAMKGNFDEVAVSAIAKEQGDLTAQMIVARQRVKSQIFAILTDEQKAKAEHMRDTIKERFEKRMNVLRDGDQKKSNE